MNRRGLLLSGAGLALFGFTAEAGPIRRHRRRVRRRIRRRALWRMVGGRRLLVVPLAVAVGWELMREDGVVVVVREVHASQVIVEANGKRETIEIVKEDTKENQEDLEGSETDGADT